VSVHQRKAIEKPLAPPRSVRNFYARELRFHREQQDMSRDELARLLHVTPSYLAHVEAARRCVTGAIAGHLDEVLPSDGFFTRNLAAGLAPGPAGHAAVLTLEADATGITQWSPLLVPAPLRTGAYAHAVARARHPFTHPTTPPTPPRPAGAYAAVLSEAALLRQVGGAAVMAEELRHVAELVRQRRIAVQVLPFQAGAHAGMNGAFTLLAFDDDGLVAHAGGTDVGVLVENPPAVAPYVRVYRQVQELALPPEESLNLIEATATQYEAQAFRERARPAPAPGLRTAAPNLPTPHVPGRNPSNCEDTPMTSTPASPVPADTSAEASTALSDQNQKQEPDQKQKQEPEPDGAARRWTITTVNGITVSGYLPGWAEADPSRTGVAPERLPITLVDITHRRAFDGITLTAFTEGGTDKAHAVNAFQSEIQCHPCPDPELPDESLIPVVNIQISPECWMTDLGPDELTHLAPQLRTLADRIDGEVLPALVAARADWEAHGGAGKGAEAAG
jgi:hypothetical protein